jgi:hypothetical protein
MSSERKPPDDRELEDFLAGKHPVGRAYREVSEQQTAPRELDDAILKMAREHVAPTHDTVVPLRRRPRWVQPVALAATLALSVGVLMNIWRDPALRQQAAPIEQGGEEALAPATSTTSQPESAATAEPQAAPIEQQPPADLQAAPKPRAKAEVSPAPESRRAAEPFPATQAARPAGRERDESLSDSVSPSAVSPRAGAAMPTPAPQAPPPPPAASQAQSGGAASSRPDIDPRLMEREDPKSDSYSLTPDAAAARTPAIEEQKRIQSDDARAMAKEKSAARKSMAADAAPEEAESANAQERDAPETLIERARAAVARGQSDEARRLVAELRRLHPDTPLPEDLRAFAPPAP